MNIAFIAKLLTWAPVQKLFGKWAPPTYPLPQQVARSSTASSPVQRQVATEMIAVRAQPTGGLDPHHHRVRPLRIVRMVEKGQPRSSVGRMVISGRMADVCAELDRLAARETALV